MPPAVAESEREAGRASIRASSRTTLGIAVKRWLVALLVLLAVIVLISPGIVGRLAEQNLDENIDWVEGENPNVSVSTERFDRGWFTSEGRHRVVFEGGAFHDVAVLYSGGEVTELPALIIDTRIDHGLLPVSSLSRESGSLMPGLATTISPFQVDPGAGDLITVPGVLYSNIGVSGTSKSRFVRESGSFARDEFSATWQGADLLVISSPSAGGIAVEGNIQPFSLVENNERVDFGSITADIDETSSDFGFSVGSIEFEMESLSAESANGPFSMGVMSLTADTSIDDSRLNGTSTFSMQDVVVPGMGNVGLDMDISMQGLDAASLGKVSAALREVQGEDDPEAALQAIYPQIEGDVQKLVASGAEINFNQFDLQLPQGKLSTQLQVKFAEIGDAAPFSWSSVLLAMTASMNMRIPVALYEFVLMMNPQAESLVAMGVLKRVGDDYVMDAEYAQGLLNVNGAPMPIPMPTM
jgi:uncharacterized protein YdgA (DUF945 family)